MDNSGDRGYGIPIMLSKISINPVEEVYSAISALQDCEINGWNIKCFIGPEFMKDIELR